MRCDLHAGGVHMLVYTYMHSLMQYINARRSIALWQALCYYGGITIDLIILSIIKSMCIATKQQKYIHERGLLKQLSCSSALV